LIPVPLQNNINWNSADREGRMATRRLAGLICAMTVTLGTLGGAAFAQTPATAPSPPGAVAPPVAAALEPGVLETLRRMSDLLKGAKSLTFTYRSLREQADQNGQMVDFLHETRVAVTRPNRFRFDTVGDVSIVTVWYDGKMMTWLDPVRKLYADVEAPATIDGALMLLTEKLQTPIPVAGLILSDPYARMVDGLETAVDLGVVTVDGVRCRHLLFREADADWQLWVEAGPRPLPRRLKIVYTQEPGAPRVLAILSDWSLDAKLPASRFVVVKPAGAVRIEVKGSPGQ
jgi:hypothetical protein